MKLGRRTSLLIALVLSSAAVGIWFEARARHDRKQLIVQSRSSDPNKRAAAVDALQDHVVRWYGRDRVTLAELMKIVRTDPERDVVGAAVFVLKSIGGSEVAEVRAFYQSLFAITDGWRKYTAACQLYSRDVTKLAYMVEHFASQDPSTREALLLGMGIAQDGDRVDGIERLFAQGLDDSEPRVRTAAAIGLSSIETSCAREALQRRLAIEADTGVRYVLKTVLGFSPSHLDKKDAI